MKIEIETITRRKPVRSFMEDVNVLLLQFQTILHFYNQSKKLRRRRLSSEGRRWLEAPIREGVPLRQVLVMLLLPLGPPQPLHVRLDLTREVPSPVCCSKRRSTSMTLELLGSIYRAALSKRKAKTRVLQYPSFFISDDICLFFLSTLTCKHVKNEIQL